MNTTRAVERLSLAIDALRHSADDNSVREISKRIGTVRTALESGDDSLARNTLKTARVNLGKLYSVAPASAPVGEPIRARSEPTLLPGVETAITRLGEALDFLGEG